MKSNSATRCDDHENESIQFLNRIDWLILVSLTDCLIDWCLIESIVVYVDSISRLWWTHLNEQVESTQTSQAIQIQSNSCSQTIQRFPCDEFKREQDAHHGNGWFFMHHVSSHRPITSCCRRAYMLTNVINCHVTVSHDVQMMSNISLSRHMTDWRLFERCFTSSWSFHRLKQCSINYTATIGDSVPIVDVRRWNRCAVWSDESLARNDVHTRLINDIRRQVHIVWANQLTNHLLAIIRRKEARTCLCCLFVCLCKFIVYIGHRLIARLNLIDWSVR